MPPIYNYDNSSTQAYVEKHGVFSEAAAYYTQQQVVATAFSQNAPKQEKGLFAPRTSNDILSKIPMPRDEDHGWGQHIATFEVQTPRTTPFN